MSGKTTWWWGLAVVLLGSGGCAAPLDRFERALEEAGVARFAEPGYSGCSVEVRTTLDAGQPAGRGAVIGERWVLTADHVLGGRDRAFVATTRAGSWVEARVLRRVAADPEDLVLLEVEVDEGAYGALLGFSGFDAAAVLRPSPTCVAARVVTRRGAMAWRPGVLAPGDSGSPVLDEEGRLVGVVSGRRGAVGVFVPLTPRVDGPLLAARQP